VTRTKVATFLVARPLLHLSWDLNVSPISLCTFLHLIPCVCIENGCDYPALKTAPIPHTPIILSASPCVSLRAWSIMPFVDRIEIIIIHYVRAMQNAEYSNSRSSRYEVDSARRTNVSTYSAALGANSCCESALASLHLSRIHDQILSYLERKCRVSYLTRGNWIASSSARMLRSAAQCSMAWPGSSWFPCCLRAMCRRGIAMVNGARAVDVWLG
jgi:hypothetical protein